LFPNLLATNYGVLLECLSYSASAHALVWIDYPCCDCAQGYVSCSCTAKAKANYLGTGAAAAAAAVVGVWYAAPVVIEKGAEYLAYLAYIFSRPVFQPVQQPVQ